MDRKKNATCTDFDLLNRIKPLLFLSPMALHELASGLDSANFKKRLVIFDEEALTAGVHILLRGVAKITCLNPAGQRVTVALLAPGPIPEFLSLPIKMWHFRCEAHSDCRVGSLSWNQFDIITKAAPQSALRKFHENNLMPWYRFFGESLDVRERLLFALLQLCSDFGVAESRGTLLRISLSQKDLAGLAGASRPRVTEHLAELVREHLLIRDGRQMIVRLDEMRHSTSLKRPATNGLCARKSVRTCFSQETGIYSPRSLEAVDTMKSLRGERSARPVSRFANKSSASA